MTDTRRTILWVVFTMSLFFLWDAWNKHTGQPGLFAGPRPAASAPAGATGGASGVPQATATPPALSASAGAVAGAGAPAAPTGSAAPTAASEKITLKTDVMKVVVDTLGGTLSHVELLKFADQHDPTRPMVLLDQSAKRLYLAQTGLITAVPGVNLPNHLTPMSVTTESRELGAGAQELVLKLESLPVDGRRLVKTYTFKRGSYLVGVKHELVNESAAAVTPQVYVQLARDGNAPEGESSFYSTFTGPALYTDANKFHKVEFKDIDKGKAEHDKSANNGWVAMVQHYFTAAWLLPGAVQREFRTAKVADNHYTIAMVAPMGEVAPGTTGAFEAQLYTGPQEEDVLSALAPGLELVKDYGWLTVIAKPLFWLLS